MLKIFLILTAVIVLGAAGYSWVVATGSTVPENPITEATSGAIKTKVQSGVTLKIASLRHRMEQTKAAPEKPMILAIQKESAELHEQMKETIRQLGALGESEEQILHWVNLVQWPQFVADEKLFNEFAAQQ